LRGIRSNEDLWFDIHQDPRSVMFFEQADARALSQNNARLDAGTTANVSYDVLKEAIKPQDFLSFGSAKAPGHSTSVQSATLESQPHNSVHNNIGGFMQDLMSPTDPIFFLHHANLDRIWDVWTRKQQRRGLPILPAGDGVNPPAPGTDYYRWSREPFLFFVDRNGAAVTQKTAADYRFMSTFGYEYQPGSGEELVALPVVANAPETFAPTSGVRAMNEGAASSSLASFRIPPGILGSADRSLYAVVELSASMDHHTAYDVFVNLAPGENATPASPSFAGSYRMFGHRSGMSAFTIALSPAVTRLRTLNRVSVDRPIDVRVVPRSMDGTVIVARISDVFSIVIQAL
jgi:tyrosinase